MSSESDKFLPWSYSFKAEQASVRRRWCKISLRNIKGGVKIQINQLLPSTQRRHSEAAAWETRWEITMYWCNQLESSRTAGAANRTAFGKLVEQLLLSRLVPDEVCQPALCHSERRARHAACTHGKSGHENSALPLYAHQSLQLIQ